MPKPGSRAHTPSDEMARFTDRESQQAAFQRHLYSANEPQVLVFYGVGGTGKTWLLRKLRELVPADIPSAYLDFEVTAGGKRFVDDSVSALQSIRQQLSAATPRFDLALAMLHHKQGHVTEPGSGIPWMDVAGEILSDFVPGTGPIMKFLSKSALVRLEGTPLERLLRSHLGTDLVIKVRRMTDQELENELLNYLSEDLAESLPPHLNRAVTCVIFLDTFEAVGAGFQNKEHKCFHEKWVQDLAAQCPFAFIVIAGQNRLSWDEDPDWAEYLDQHLVGGLSEDDARQFLARCNISNADIQDCILASSKESTGGYHCFSLGLCANIVANERNAGHEPAAETLRFNPQDWVKLARRFLKSLDSDTDSVWIEKLALTPRFDEAAARWAYSSERSAAQTAAWKNLYGYSFVERLSDSEWSSIRAEMRAALRNQPSAQERVIEDHEQWKDYWSSRSKAMVDDAAGLAWYHSYCLNPSEAMRIWSQLAESARTSVPARMREHSSLLQWLDPLELLETHPLNKIGAKALFEWGDELSNGSLSRSSNLQKAIACYESALRIYTEQEFPQDWAEIQKGIGTAWSELPVYDPDANDANLTKSISHYEAALRVYTEQRFPQDWASIQDDLGNVWARMISDDVESNVTKAIAYYEAALRVYTEKEFPKQWAMVQNNLGRAWCDPVLDGLEANLPKAIACFEAVLRVYTEQGSPVKSATAMKNLGSAWSGLTMGDRASNIRKAIAYYEGALRVYTEQEYPQDWASIQNGLASAWSEMPVGDRTANLTNAIACYEAALRVYSEQEFSEEWASATDDLGDAWRELPTGDTEANLQKAIACYEASLRFYSKSVYEPIWEFLQCKLGSAWSDLSIGDRASNLRKAIAYYEEALQSIDKDVSPENWARVQDALGTLWRESPTGDTEANLIKAVTCYEAALRVYTEQDFPLDWARVQTDLGNACSDLATGDRATNLSKAVACYDAALRVYTEHDFPRDHDAVAGRRNRLNSNGGPRALDQG